MDDLTRHVERAVLGALLSGAAPGQASSLHAGDFTDPVHQAIFTAITDPEVAGSGRFRRFLAWLRSGGIRAHRDYMADLPAACPDAAHLPSYIQMLLATRQQRAAETRPGPAAADPLASAADWLTARTRDPGQARAAGQPAETTRLATALSGQARKMTATRSAGPRDHAWSREPAPGRPAPEDNAEPLTRTRVEELVLADLMARPADARAVIGWLPGDSFTTPATRQLYELISGLLDAGSPVDPVIVAWEASELARNPDPRATKPAVSPEDVLRISAIDTPRGTAATLGRGLFADQVCTVKLGPDWVTQPGLTRANSVQARPASADPKPAPAPGNQPSPVPLNAQGSQQAAPVRFQQPRPEHPQPPAPVPGL